MAVEELEVRDRGLTLGCRLPRRRRSDTRLIEHKVSKGAVRSGNLLWVPGGADPTNAAYPEGFEAFDANCTSNCEPVVDLTGSYFMDYPNPYIAVAGGTALIQTWGIGQVLAYRLN
jgi:hypothetical protein